MLKGGAGHQVGAEVAARGEGEAFEVAAHSVAVDVDPASQGDVFKAGVTVEVKVGVFDGEVFDEGGAGFTGSASGVVSPDLNEVIAVEEVFVAFVRNAGVLAGDGVALTVKLPGSVKDEVAPGAVVLHDGELDVAVEIQVGVVVVGGVFRDDGFGL